MSESSSSPLAPSAPGPGDDHDDGAVGCTRSADLVVHPNLPTLTGFSVSPTSVPGGTPATGTVTLGSPAPAGGVAVSLSSSLPGSASVPDSVTVPAGATSASFTVTTFPVDNTTAQLTATLGETILFAPLGITRTSSIGTPTLQTPASGATGVTQPVAFNWTDVSNAVDYEIQIDNSSTISAPFVASQIVNVSQASIGGFPAQELWWRVRARNSAGTFGSFSSTRRFTPVAAPVAATLSAVSVSPTSVVGGAASTGTVTLTAAAPTGGMVVSLSSSNSAATVPASVTVAAGATTATFTASTSAVTAQTPITITATAGSVSRTATLTVNPPATGTLPAPSLVRPASDARFNSGQSIVFDWSDVAGAASYIIQIDNQQNFSSPTVNQTVSTSTYSTSTLPRTRMWWRVRAVDASGVAGSWSSVRRFEVR